MEMNPPYFYIQVRHHQSGLFLFVYDEELIEREGTTFYRKKVDKRCDEGELALLFHRCVSVNLFGRKAIEKAIDEGYVHPSGVSRLRGVPCAIFIKT